MNSSKVLGIILLVGGALLLFFGLSATDSVGETVKEGITGKFTERTTWYIVGGAAAAIAGAWLTFASSPRRT
jgi:hypothetical protein